MLHYYRLYLSCFLLFFAVVGSLRAQEQLPLDTLCVTAGEGFIINLLADDFPAGQNFDVRSIERECFRVDRQGNLFFGEFAGEGICCGGEPNFFVLEIFEPGSTGQILFLQPVELTIKCPKPECGIVDLTEYRPLSPTMGDEPTQGEPDCIQACENSTAIYLFPEDPNLEYNWTAVNGVAVSDPGLPGQVSVTWGDVAGGGVLTGTTTDDDGNILDTRSWCIELTPSPVADFTATSVACLDQPVYFTNTSTGAAATYDWDFGDGNTQQNVTNPSHVYETAGTFTVTLYATSDGTNPDGSQACCCTDTISYDITIDPLPGPQIYWISTLCEGDASKYWTDATGCDYTWSVSGNGTMTPTGFPDTIMVTWGSGPSGTVSLQVENCDDVYCDQPTVAVVPIISTNGVISGPIEVCKGENANYELPKWLTVAYDWGVNAGAINGSNNGHVVNVTWPTTPGTYVIEAGYGSDFLNGLPNHEGDDCYGTARLEVTVLGDFTLSATPNPACIYQSVTIFGTSDIDAGATYDWSVVGFPGLTGTGPAFAINPGDVPGPGVYTVTATVTNPGDYCVATHSINVVIKEAITPVIDGPTDYCVGEPVVYTIVSPAAGYTYNWTVVNGSVDAGQGSPTATITFTSTTGVSLSVTGTDSGSPACTSEPATVTPVTKDFMGSPEIYGPEPCTNSLADYGITDQQHPDATYSWSVTPATSGSVVEGVNDSVATIQWNNDDGPVTITLEIELCGQTLTLTEDLDLNAPIEPEILQDGDLCPSGSAFLYVDDSTNFSSFVWTLPQGAGPTTGGFTITSPGNYVVNTIDINGCPGVARYRVETVDGPEVTLSVDGVRAICVDNVPYPPNPVITATTGAASDLIEWFCNGISQGAAATGNTTLTHVWNDTIKVYAYTVLVTDVNGCTSMPDPVFIRQEACCGPPYETQPLPENHTFTLVRNSPDCDIVDLVATWPADSVDCHAFDLPLYSQVIDFGGDETAANDSLTIRLPGVGCYQIDSEIFRWAYDYDTTSVFDPVTNQPIDSIFVVDSIKCGTEIRLDVCNPLLAEFDYSEDCGVVTFENESLVDLSLVSGTVNYDWDFGDTPVATSTDENPTHTYTTNGTYTVTLVVSDDDCQSTYVLSVVVDDIPDSDFTFAPAPVCAGQPVTFTGTGSNVIEWFWDFGDGATFNGNGPQHTFNPPVGVDDYDVTLTTTNSAGCEDVVVKTIDIFPTPEADTIEASNGFIICDGESTVLSVDNIAGYTYEWNTGATTSSISVSTAGTYDVTITNSDDCSIVVGPVTVQLIPLPDASWKGNPYICDVGTTTLMALAGGGHTFEWTNLTNGAAPVGSGPNYIVGWNISFPVQNIRLRVISNDYGCVSETIIEVNQVDSPAPILAVAGGLCEGDGSTISVTNPEPDVVYSWNTGEVGTSIFTYQAGVYTVLATNTISGCTGSASVTIFPLPDLCEVPTGCYETCAPDTLCAPAGDYSYAWFQNGAPAAAAQLLNGGQKLIVTESASYSVTVFDNVTGCFASSDSLYLEVIDCDETDCDDIVTEFKDYVDPDGEGGCCVELIYGFLPDGIYAIQITSPDAELSFIPGSVNPLFGYAANANPYTIELGIDGALSAPLPANAPAASALAFCPENFISSPQEVIINYLGADLEVVCSDTLRTECEVEPECLYITRDTLTCTDDNLMLLTFEACVPLDSDYDIGHIVLLPSSAAAAIDLPIDIPVFPVMQPGDCRTFTVLLSNLPDGEDFCYTLVAHTADPDENPDALCCSDGEPRCLKIPDCDPCDELLVEGVVPTNEGCCYDIYLFDGEEDYDFDGIDLCLLNSDATLSVFSSLGDPLVGSVGITGQTVSVTASSGGILPDGLFQLPRICLNDSEAPETDIEIKWLQNGKVVCRDTITVFCKPPCGYLEEENIECDGPYYVWSGSIVSTSMFTMGEAHITFDPADGLSAYDTTIVFTTPLNMGDSEFVQILIGDPAMPLDSVCFTVTLHELSDDDDHLNCCRFEACIQLPDCELIDECLCEDLDVQVDLGVTFTPNASNSLAYTFAANGNFQDCDQIRWFVRRLNPVGPWAAVGTASTISYTFPGGGAYQVAFWVQRTDDNGEVCTRLVYYNVNVDGAISDDPSTNVKVYPNPASTEVFVQAPEAKSENGFASLNLYNMNGQLARAYHVDLSQQAFGQPLKIDVRGLAPGVYILRGEAEDSAWTTRFIVE